MAIHKVNSVVRLKDGTVLAVRCGCCDSNPCYFKAHKQSFPHAFCAASVEVFNKKDIHIVNDIMNCDMTIGSNTHFEKIEGGV